MNRPTLRLDWCTHEAAKYAVEKWHYSQRMPLPPLVSIGVWEDGQFVGCVLFSRGANKNLASPYGLSVLEVAELTRVALTRHASPVSRIVAVAVRMLRTRCPGLRLLVSFADPSEGHHGGIYQAGNWIYTSCSEPQRQFFVQGRWVHQRAVVSRVAFGKPHRRLNYEVLPSREAPGKHRYILPFDDEIRARVLPLARPYPKRAGSADSGTAVNQTEGGGAHPTPALSTTTKE